VARDPPGPTYGCAPQWMDVKDKYNLVIITPGSPTRAWTEADDEYLHNMVDLVVGAVGKENVDHFILAGHSQGGMTSNRIICTDYFKDKVDVRISLSGGRIGPVTPANRGFGAGFPPVYRSGDPDATPATQQRPRLPSPAASGPPVGVHAGNLCFAVVPEEIFFGCQLLKVLIAKTSHETFLKPFKLENYSIWIKYH